MIFCSKKGHQIYPLEIERVDKNGNILVSPCKECEEEISNVVKERIDEYKIGMLFLLMRGKRLKKNVKKEKIF